MRDRKKKDDDGYDPLIEILVILTPVLLLLLFGVCSAAMGLPEPNSHLDVSVNGFTYHGADILEERDNGDLLIKWEDETILVHGTYTVTVW